MNAVLQPVLCAAIACAIAAAEGVSQQLLVAWELPPGGVAVGEPFVAEVSCTLPALPPGPWFDERSLWPVALEPIGDRRERVGDLERGVIRYRARAFAAGRLEFAEIGLRAPTAAGEVVAAGTPPPLDVRSVLPSPSGDLEWPDVLEPPGSARFGWLVAVAVGAAVASAWFFRRPPRAAPPLQVRHDAVLAALAALPQPGDDPAAIASFYRELATLVRHHAGRRFAVPVDARTSEELTAVVAVAREPFAACLQACDRVKFAAHVPGASVHEATRALAEQFVRASSPPEGA